LQGFIKLKLKEGKYKLLAIISDKTSKRERRIHPIDLNISESERILDPIIFDPNKILCEGNDSYVLLNNSSAVPFNKTEDILAIPVIDSSINSLKINVTRGDTTFLSNVEDNKSIFYSASFGYCNDEIIIKRDENGPDIKYFLFNNISAKLTEGPVKLEVIPDNDVEKKKIFKLEVIWIGKPFSLRDPEEAIKLLTNVESEDKVDQMLDGDDEMKELNSYWTKLDPTPDTKYNELMNEFYQRVDYCEMEFKSIDGKGGANTDRGKIYIKYGPPNRIDRNTTNQDKVVESWFYDHPKRSFVFIDKDGTGKYTLYTGQ
jgi:GWxTD domain-containing protein